jgi:hypothetical protein
MHRERGQCGRQLHNLVLEVQSAGQNRICPQDHGSTDRQAETVNN